ncbi:MAG: EAL domain-containing protein, partial [Hyphomicrobiales bacterium]|nr:EAL domain-containing protein [Hyphomicrobiales bacterium]
MGFDLSIDDFGTGASNIEQLRNFPFSELKIDRSFVTKMAEDAFAMASVKASIDLGQKLDLRLVAEGVETETVRDLVAKLKVDQIQGYLFGKPVPAEEFLQELQPCREPALT